MKQRLLLGLLLCLLAACSSNQELEAVKPPDVLYREAHNSMQYRNFLQAEARLKRILSRYPFTEFAVQAQLDLLYVLMQLDQPEALEEEADRFIRENPRHPRIDYVYYMKGLGYYRATPNFLVDIADIDVARRDVTDAERAFRHLGQLVNRFPESEYAADARTRMIELKDRIARHEMIIAEYYVRRGAWISAIQRAQRVLKELQGTPAEIDALIVLARGYEALGLDELAETPRRILAENPDRKPVVFD